MHIENTGVYDVSLAFEVGEEIHSSQDGTLLSVQSIHWKHNNKINKHSNNHTTKQTRLNIWLGQGQVYHNNSICKRSCSERV